jgi:hypothetical protein
MTAAITRRAMLDRRYDAICDDGNLTRRQLLIWAGNRLAPDVPVFTEGALLHIHGRIDANAFARAYHAVVAEADALRMIVDDVSGWPRQRVRACESRLELVDLSSRTERPGGLERLVRDRFADTTGGDRGTINTALIRLRPAHYVWLLVQHQLVSDAWSFRLIHQRLSDHYRRDVAGAVRSGAEPPQFQRYLDYERRYRGSAAGRRARAYWENQSTAAAPSAVEPRLGRDGTRVERMSCRLDEATSAAVRRLARAESASLDTGLFCVFASLVIAHLGRTKGTREVTLSVPFSNRPGERFKNTIGSFMTVCPVRIAGERGDSFLDLYRRVQWAMWDAARHQGYAVRQTPVDQPYDVLVNIHKERVAVRGFAGLSTEVEWVAPSHRFGALALAVQDFNGAGVLSLAFDFNVAAFAPPARAEMIRELRHLLVACVADPSRRPADVGRAPAPSTASVSASASTPTAQDDGVESAVAAIWRELLELDGVRSADDFFELGGDSLLAFRMLARVRAALLVEIAAETFLDDPTVAGVASAVRAVLADGPSAAAVDGTPHA